MRNVRKCTLAFNTMSQQCSRWTLSYVLNSDRSKLRIGVVIGEIILNNTDILPTVIVVPAANGRAGKAIISNYLKI